MVHGWKFNLAVEDAHDGRRRQWLPWVALSWPRRGGGHVDEEEKSHELVFVAWFGSIGGTLQGNRTISGALSAGGGWVGLVIDTRTEVDDVQSPRPQPSSIGR